MNRHEKGTTAKNTFNALRHRFYFSSKDGQALTTKTWMTENKAEDSVRKRSAKLCEDIAPLVTFACGPTKGNKVELANHKICLSGR